MPFIRGIPGENVILSLQLTDGVTNQYPQAKVYDDAGALNITVNLTHVASGNYQGTFSNSESPSYFTVVYTTYSDAARTVINTDYEIVEDKIFIKYEADYAPGYPGLSREEIKAISEKVWNLELVGYENPLSAGFQLYNTSKFDPFLQPVFIEKVPGIEKIDVLSGFLLKIEDIEKKIAELPDYKVRFIDLKNNLEEIKTSLSDKTPHKKIIEILKVIAEWLKISYQEKNTQDKKSIDEIEKSLNSIEDLIKKIPEFSQSDFNETIFSTQKLLFNLEKNALSQIKKESQEIQEKIGNENPKNELLNAIKSIESQHISIISFLKILAQEKTSKDIINLLLDLKNDVSKTITQSYLFSEREQKKLREIFNLIEDNFFDLTKKM